MSITRLPREMGIVVHCDSTSAKSCPHGMGGQPSKFHTGNIMAGNTRAGSRTRRAGGRGLRKGYKRRDLCPVCLKLERELFTQEQADTEAWKKQRAENRKARMSAESPPKKPRKSRKKSAAVPEVNHSPSVGSVPAPA
jgi:undecaprenyl pyrophosphate synthase